MAWSTCPDKEAVRRAVVLEPLRLLIGSIESSGSPIHESVTSSLVTYGAMLPSLNGTGSAAGARCHARHGGPCDEHAGEPGRKAIEVAHASTYSPVLRTADILDTAVPWWGGRTLHFDYARKARK